MNRRDLGITLALLIAGITVLGLILRAEPRDDGHAPQHEAVPAGQAPRGPHGGRLLVGEGLTLEMTIYEPGIPPQSRVYPFVDERSAAPRDVELRVELRRFDRVDVLSYAPLEDFLLGDTTVDEPHSFDVRVKARFK